MTVRSRLARVERLWCSVGEIRASYCSTCMRTSCASRTILIVPPQVGVLSCGKCGFPVDLHGRTVGYIRTHGGCMVKVLVTETEPVNLAPFGASPC